MITKISITGHNPKRVDSNWTDILNSSVTYAIATSNYFSTEPQTEARLGNHQ